MKMNKVIAVSLFFMACGDDVTEIVSQTSQNMEIVSEESDLPECTEDNEGEQVFVKGELYARVCIDKKWTSVLQPDKDTVLVKNDEASCHTVQLADGQGVKIVCNGDSIGVLLNGEMGAKGAVGDVGASCSLKRVDSTSVRLYCDGDTTTLSLKTPPDVVCGKASVTLDSLVGTVQNFLKGSEISLYELNDGCSIEKTGKIYQGEILDDDGRYNVPKIKISCQYVLAKAKGYYRNEVTGEKSNEPIELNALVNLQERKVVNVNLLTHLEFGRILEHLSQGESSLQNAKNLAHKEIMDVFHIKTDKMSEDMDATGDAEEDAELFAISVLLRNNQKESEFVDFLNSFALWIDKDGVWKNNADKAYVVDWGLRTDVQGELPKIRKNYGKTFVPVFENYLRRFVGLESGLGVCGSDSVPKGAVRNVTDKYSELYSDSYRDTSKNAIRFICVNTDSIGWRVATDVEKDTMGTGFMNAKDGAFVNGLVTGKRLVWDSDTIRYETGLDKALERGCVSYLRDTSMIVDGQYSYYRCTDEGWKYDFDHLNYGTLVDSRDGKTYKTIGIKTQVWMAENLDFEYVVNDSVLGNFYNEGCALCGRYYRFGAAVDSAAVFSDNAKDCGMAKVCSLVKPVRGVCPEGWHIPSHTEWATLYHAVGNNPFALQSKGYDVWPEATNDYGLSLIPSGKTSNSNAPGLFSVAEILGIPENPGTDCYYWLSADAKYLRTQSWQLAYTSSCGNSARSVRCVKD